MVAEFLLNKKIEKQPSLKEGQFNLENYLQTKEKVESFLFKNLTEGDPGEFETYALIIHYFMINPESACLFISKIKNKEILSTIYTILVYKMNIHASKPFEREVDNFLKSLFIPSPINLFVKEEVNWRWYNYSYSVY